ncbi:MFS transporter [Lactobacillus amylolyticus]|nr:MFS transporter [Lactobacillus amylolyticus]QFY05251.1 MFS transporter [Lactobacillus amylolyticus]
MMLIAANLRLPITLMPPLLPDLEQTLHLPSSLAGLLTSIPLVTFAIFSPLIVKLAQRWGNARTVLALFLLLILGSYGRIIPNVVALFFGTFLVGIGVDSGNVLIPALIKERVPDQIQLGTSLYTLSMLLVGALGTAAAGYLITSLSFGLQSLVYYVLLTWLPTILTTHGVSTIVASNLLTLFQLSGLPLAFLVPYLFNKRHGTPLLLTIMTLGYVVAPLTFLLPTHSLPFLTTMALISGLGSGVAFNLAIMFFTEKTHNPYQTAAISGMAQSAGYLLAAVGPILFGTLATSLHAWNPVLLLLVVCAIALTVTGIVVDRHAMIAD